MDLQLKNKRALVTGSSKGLGYATAHLLALEGCFVAINGRDPQSLQKAAETLVTQSGTRVIPVYGDVTQPDVPAKLVEETVKSFGGLDLLVTNASGPPSGKFETFDDLAWQKAVDQSFLNHVRLIRAALPYLRRSSNASVVTITSYAIKQPIPNLVLSNSVRAATGGLTKSLSFELGSDGIRFNSVLPGWTTTERVVDLMSYRAKANGTNIDEEIALQVKETALGRMASPEEIANAIVFLLSPAASYITGVMLAVDGGIIKGTF
jgi:3-oxoacyl-[acyl-carrier protein] reductase